MTSPAEQPEKKPVKKRFRWRRLAAWFSGSALFIVLLLAAAVWWLWTYRVDYINRSLAAMHGKIKNLTLSRDSAVIHDFEFRDDKTNELLLRLPEVVIKASATDLQQRHINLVTLNDAEIDISDSTLKKLLGQDSSSDSSGAILLPGGWKIARVELLNTRLRYHDRDGTNADLVVNFHGNDLSTSAEGFLSVAEQELTICRVAIARGQHVPVTLESLHTRGQVHDGKIVLDEFSIVKPELALTPESLKFLKPNASPPIKAEPEVTPEAQAQKASFINGLQINRVKLENVVLSATGFIPGNIAGIELPNTKARLSYETTDFKWTEGLPISPGSQRLHVENLELKSPTGTGSILCKEINLVVPPPIDGRWTIQELRLREPAIVWTPELHKLLMPEKPQQPQETNAEVKSQPWAIFVQNAEVRDGRVSIADVGLMSVEMSGDLSLNLRDLLLDDKGWHSGVEQLLELKNYSIGYPAKKPFFELESGQLAIIPDAWTQSYAVNKLVMNKPLLRLRDENTPWFSVIAPPPASAPAQNSGGPSFDWQQLHYKTLAITEGAIDMAYAQSGQSVDLHTQITVSTDPDLPGTHRFRLENLEASLPGRTLFPFPVARASYIEGVASLPEVWKDHRVKSLEVGGANVEISEALMKTFEGEAPAGVATETKAAAPSGPAWTIGNIRIKDSLVTLDKLVPGMESVNFLVTLDLKDAPLTADGLALDTAPQRVELSNLLIPSPYGGNGPPVAKLDSVFLEFTLAGLAKKQIEKVEIVSPTLYIGQPLFEYVDYYRKYTGPSSDVTVAKVEFGDKTVPLVDASTPIKPETITSDRGWSLHILQVHSGKLIIAPKGVPLKGFRTPFPFNFTSEVTRGTLKADFEIQPDNYEIEELKLAFEGLRGKVQFNLPLKDRDNNLTETFKVNRIRWKELHIEDSFLTVTYDAAGIYAKFGGKAYEGYVNGEVNIYLDDVYSWDGWITGKDVQTREITQKLFPAYFFMEGKIATKLIAVGDGKELHQADGNFINQTPGRFSVKALNDLIKTLPESMNGVKEQLAQLSLETLRDLAYERAESNFRTYGREGRGTLIFTGPDGTRKFEINAIDHRWKLDAPPEKAGVIVKQEAKQP